MYEGITNGTIKTKAEKLKEDEDSINKLMMFAPVIDNRRNKTECPETK